MGKVLNVASVNSVQGHSLFRGAVEEGSLPRCLFAGVERVTQNISFENPRALKLTPLSKATRQLLRVHTDSPWRLKLRRAESSCVFWRLSACFKRDGWTGWTFHKHRSIP